MMEKARSINDVARMAGVSPATVSNVLTGRKRVSAKLVKKVEAAVKALDYRTDPRASMLRSGEAKIIAVVVPDLDNPFFTSVVSAVEQCLGPEAYEVIVASSHGEEEDREVQAEGDSGMASGGTDRHSVLRRLSGPAAH